MMSTQDMSEQIAAGATRKPNKNLKFIIGGLVIVVAVAYLVYTGIQSTSAYFMTIDEVYSQNVAGRQLRVSGMVDPDSIDYNHSELILKFSIVSDETGQQLPVVFNGPKPDQMTDDPEGNVEAIIEGTFDGDAFEAQSLLLKCPSRYEEGENELQVSVN